MTWVRTEEEVDALIQEMLNKNKGRYITQGVAFNKSSESQMRLLKLMLMSSYSFGAMVKELIAEKFSENPTNNTPPPPPAPTFTPPIPTTPPPADFKQFETPVQNDFKQFENVKNNPSRNLGNFV